MTDGTTLKQCSFICVIQFKYTVAIERYLLTAFAMHIFIGKKKCYVRKTLLTLHLKVNFFGGINTSSETSEDMQVIV